MAAYRVFLARYASVCIRIDSAPDEETAINLAYESDESYVSLCHQEKWEIGDPEEEATHNEEDDSWSVSLNYCATAQITVDNADDEETAIDKAWSIAPGSLCHQEVLKLGDPDDDNTTAELIN